MTTTSNTAANVLERLHHPGPDVHQIKRHFPRGMTEVQIRCGFPDIAPVIGHFAGALGASADGAHTLVLCQGVAAQLVLLADRGGRVHADGCLFADRATGAHSRVSKRAAMEVLQYLASMHKVLRVFA